MRSFQHVQQLLNMILKMHYFWARKFKLSKCEMGVGHIVFSKVFKSCFA